MEERDRTLKIYECGRQLEEEILWVNGQEGY